MTREEEAKINSCLQMLENCLRGKASFLEPKADSQTQTQQIRATVTMVLDELETLQMQRRD